MENLRIDNDWKKEAFRLRMASNIVEPVSYDEDKAWEKVRQQTLDKPVRNMRFRWLKYAAVFAGGIGVALWGYRVMNVPQAAKSGIVASIVPAEGKAELILTTGHRVFLTDQLQQEQMVEAGMKLNMESTGKRLEYLSADSVARKELTGYNTLKVHKGEKYVLVLPDSSEVTLNSESSLRFPVAFEKNKREVFLEGEAFFKVKPDKNAPFHVRAAGRDVCVLGTTFDVCAYDDDPYFRSTLVSGKVKVSGGKGEVILQPSEQYAENQETGKVEVKKVDVSLYTSWMDGKIRFKGERLEDIIIKLERWYEFEVFYANEEVKDMRFRGVINQNDPFDVVLKNLEQTTDIQFSIQDKTVIVRKIRYN